MGIDVTELEERHGGRRASRGEIVRSRAVGGFSIVVDLSDLGMDELADGAEAAVRPSAQAGAQVFYDTVKQKVAALGTKTGLLAASIYQAYSKDNSGAAVAQYHVTWRGGRRDKNTLQGGLARAPHGHLVEFGHVQRYAAYIDKNGFWKTAIRPEMHGKPPPKRNAPLAVKDAYFVPLKNGPRIVPPRSFLRASTTPDVRLRATNAMTDKFWSSLEALGLL